MTPASSTSKATSARRYVWLAVRVGVTCAALGWTLTSVPLSEMGSAFRRISPWALAAAVAMTFGNLLVGATRWRLLLAAYGASRRPSVLWLARAYLEGLFFNTFLPGNVGGDLVRAHATRAAFDGAAGAYMIVAIERVFGLAGLLALAAGVLVVHPIGGVSGLVPLAFVGLLGAAAAATSPLIAKRIAHRLPARLRAIAESLPTARTPALLLGVFALSIGTQSVVAISGHTLVAGVAPSVALVDSLVLVPVAMAAVYFPAAVAGLGVREAAFVSLFASIGVARADATAAALAFGAVQFVVALAGGPLHLFAPIGAETSPADPPR